VKRLLQFFAPAGVVLLSIAAAHADGVDPTIIIRDPVGCPSHQCVAITGLSFKFGVPKAGFGVLHFLNASGVSWHSLLLTEVGVPAVDVKCSSDVFSCSVVALGTNGAKIVLTAIRDQPGIPAGNSFEIILGCPKGNCPHWPPGLDFTAKANVPEPATLLLLSTGLGLIATRRRRSSTRTSFS
jgi:hypothetical protein